MKVARWITALVASLLLLLAAAGTANAGHPDMTYNTISEMTYN